MLKRRAIVGRYQHYAGTGKKVALNPGGYVALGGA